MAGQLPQPVEASPAHRFIPVVMYYVPLRNRQLATVGAGNAYLLAF